jgi:hypothetical protein
MYNTDNIGGTSIILIPSNMDFEDISKSVNWITLASDLEFSPSDEDIPEDYDQDAGDNWDIMIGTVLKTVVEKLFDTAQEDGKVFKDDDGFDYETWDALAIILQDYVIAGDSDMVDVLFFVDTDKVKDILFKK